MIDFTEVLKRLRPGAAWVVIENEYNGISISSGESIPTLAECESAWAEIERDYLLRPIRTERDRLLAASDWTQTLDAPMDKKAWAEYRQELRDLPATIDDPTKPIEWPSPPA